MDAICSLQLTLNNNGKEPQKFSIEVTDPNGTYECPNGMTCRLVHIPNHTCCAFIDLPPQKIWDEAEMDALGVQKFSKISTLAELRAYVEKMHAEQSSADYYHFVGKFNLQTLSQDFLLFNRDHGPLSFYARRMNVKLTIIDQERFKLICKEWSREISRWQVLNICNKLHFKKFWIWVCQWRKCYFSLQSEAQRRHEKKISQGHSTTKK
jgi:hypothetical protein